MEPRVIKKYPNRRLYDTERSRYITVEDVRALVLDGTEFKVIDAQSEQDITRNILIQIITEGESGKAATFTTEMLTRFIRLSNHTAQEAFSGYLDQSMRMFLEQQQLVRDQVKEAMTGKTLSGIAQQNLQFWQEMQQNFLKAAGLAENKKPSDRGNKRPK
jgi:polyhydroxyalkanoate synthesis repressor PhaR